MATSLLEALTVVSKESKEKEKEAYTENGELTNSTSLNACLDYFASIGGMRQCKEEATVIELFTKAFNQNKELALKALFWSRDITQGAGERKSFRTIIKYLADTESELFAPFVKLIPTYGRWDDLLVFFGTPLEHEAVVVISNALKVGDGLAAKWMPRQDKKNADQKVVKKLRTFMELTPKEYRKLLVRLTKVVETPMCANEWESIEYKTVPSFAMKNYRKAFPKHDVEGFTKYLQSVVSGEVKINSKTLYPNDLVHLLLSSTRKTLTEAETTLINEQWKALPDYTEGTNANMLVIADTSGSMNGQPMEVSKGLALYLSEKLKGPFKDSFFIFSETPVFQTVSGSLTERIFKMEDIIASNTDLQAVYKHILTKAVKHEVAAADMPTHLLIISDMEFDEAVKGQTSHETMAAQYITAGYTIPNVIYWNVSARSAKNFPVTALEDKTALVSGYSPSIIKSILSCSLVTEETTTTTTEDGIVVTTKTTSSSSNLNPTKLMLETLNGERYAPITLA